MRTAEPLSGPPPGGGRRWAWAGLAAVLAGGLGLRLWGVGQGLPFAYNTDEADHFVSHAVRMFREGTLNPHYFANPPAFTYLLHGLYAIAYGGGSGVIRAFALHPAELYTLARVAAAGLGTLAVWLLYGTGARLFGRGVGLLAAAILAVAFLPVFYAHLALNDVPTLAPLTLSLLGTAGILRKGRARDHLVAGVGLGLACASKYTAGIVLIPLAVAIAARYLDGGPRAGRRALAGLLLAGGSALAAFLLANPYSLLDYGEFHGELVHQSTLSAESQGKLGAPRGGGLRYYLWALTWGLGWVPSLAALGGALTVWRAERRLGWLLVPAPILFLLFMGLQGRYFGRWLMPILPILCLLAAFFALRLAHAGARRLARPAASSSGAEAVAGTGAAAHPGPTAGPRSAAGPASSRSAAGAGSVAGPGAVPGPAATRRGRAPLAVLTAAIVALLLAQGLLYSVHSSLVLSRADTRNLTRDWMLAHIPRGAPVVVEPVSPDEWAHEARAGTSTASNPPRWNKYPSMISRISPAGALQATTTRVSIENYERTLAPALLGYYEHHGYCWVVSGSIQSGRAYADAAAVPLAVAYYRALAQQGEVLFRASPYARGAAAVPFDFDWSFDYYPLAYTRPGPQMTVYRLHGGRCG